MSENTNAVQTENPDVDELDGEDEVVEDQGVRYVKLYTAARIMNELWERAGSDKSVTAQQLYGAAKREAGLPGLVVDENGKKLITLDGVREYWNQCNNGVRSAGRPSVSALADLVQNS